ncbi:MAG TPA: ATP-binding protein [Polyangiaceae bacterium LLY-WYZ-14_1]|nr:ATP-binding protein [Polyangiaceae bacterium LLY-WYZ-14_1]
MKHEMEPPRAAMGRRSGEGPGKERARLSGKAAQGGADERRGRRPLEGAWIRSPGIADALSEVVLVLDHRLRLVDGNDAAARELGLRLPEDEGLRVLERLGHDRRRGPTQDDLADLEGRDAEGRWQRDAWLLDGKGRRRFGRTTLLCLDDRGDGARYVALWSDRTGPRLLGQVSWRWDSEAGSPDPRPTEAALLHELLGSIAGMQNALYLAREELEGLHGGTIPASTLGHLSLTERELDRLARFGRNLRRFRTPRPRDLLPIPLGRLVDELVALAEPTALARGVAIAPEVDEDLAEILIPEDESWEALKNVLLNALQQSPPGARVDLVAKVGGPGIVFEIADRGPGIPEDQGRTVFEPFFTSREGGTGLGLATARAAVTSVGGYIEHRPRAGGGTVFGVAVPALSD